MDDRQISLVTERRPSKLARLIIVVAGIVLGQAVLYGPSLIGRKILLPLDILADKHAYLPRTPEFANVQPGDVFWMDSVFAYEPARRFAVSELHAGRLPLWAPHQFAGAPFILPKFSPFFLFECCTASPVVLAWGQMLQALVAGLGAYAFFRKGLGVGFWPATICAWCYPLTGYFIFWQSFPPIEQPVYWLPWLLLAVNRTVEGGPTLAPLGLSVATCLVVISGQLDVAAQVLLVSGLYGLWCCWLGVPSRIRDGVTDQNTGASENSRLAALTNDPPAKAGILNSQRWRTASKAAVRLAAGWTLGLMLAAPAILPVLEYTKTGVRMSRRAAGMEERPPVGLSVLPQVVLPDMYGSNERGSFYFFPQGEGNLQESTAAAYTGVLATILVAPLAWCSRRHWAANGFWALLIFFSLSWCLDVPGVVSVLRLPGLNLMSHNRLVFAASFAILALAAVGLEVLFVAASDRNSRLESALTRDRSAAEAASEPTHVGCFGGQGRFCIVQWRWWFWLPVITLAGLFSWCVYRTLFLPEQIGPTLELAVLDGPVQHVNDLEGVREVESWFIGHYAAAAVWCGVGLAGWWLVRFGGNWLRVLRPALGVLLVGDLLWFGFNRNVQCDPALYYPPIPVLQQVAQAAPGRIFGFQCLPPALPVMCGLRDIRGYDAVDPARLMDLLDIARDPRSPTYPYSSTMWQAPKLELSESREARLSPVLDMLGVRYLIFREEPLPKANPLFEGPDYWVLRNPTALERVFIPRRVEMVPDKMERLAKLASPRFDPRAVAYVETPVTLPADCSGTARIVQEKPNQIIVSVQMETTGLVVLADLWDQGWRAYLDGKPVPILRTNHAVRGVIVPAGMSMLEFRYQPQSLAWGLRFSGLAAVVLAAWTVIPRTRPAKAGGQISFN